MATCAHIVVFRWRFGVIEMEGLDLGGRITGAGWLGGDI
jgi:hypothetical protein